MSHITDEQVERALNAWMPNYVESPRKPKWLSWAEMEECYEQTNLADMRAALEAAFPAPEPLRPEERTVTKINCTPEELARAWWGSHHGHVGWDDLSDTDKKWAVDRAERAIANLNAPPLGILAQLLRNKGMPESTAGELADWLIDELAKRDETVDAMCQEGVERKFTTAQWIAALEALK